MASFSSSNDNFTANNSKQGNQSSFNTTQQAAIKELENKTAAITNSLQDTINDLNDFKEETAADLGTKQDRLIPGSHVAINEANIISSNQINDSAVSSTETYSSDKIKSITDAIENKVNTKANISYVDTNFENIRELIDIKQDKLTAGNGITISDNTISTINYIDDNKPVDNKSYSSSKTVQLDKDVYNNLYAYINSANYDGTILRMNSDGNRFGSIIHAYSGITPGTYGTKDYADATQLACFTINSEGHATGVRLDEIYPPVTAGKTYDYWISNGSKRGNWQTPDSRPIDGSRNLITSGAVFTAVKHKGVFEAGLNIDISDYVISCTAIDNETISDTKTFSSSKIQNDMQQLDESINNIEALIPAQATEENILADRDFVNSSINSVTAFYITSDTEGSPFATKAALDNAAAYYYAGNERVPTANDYCVVLEDETHENATVRYVYQSTEAGEGTWAFQYVVNDTPFTSDQLAAINSGITAAKVNKYDAMTSVEHITTPRIDAQEHLYRNIELSTNSSEDIVLEDGNGNCTLIIYSNNSSDNVLKSSYGDEITVLGAHEFVVLMYSSGWKVVARQNNDTEKKIFITEAADPVNLTEQDDTHYVVQITNVDNIPIDGVILAQLPATAKDGAIYTITNISDRRLEVYTLVEPANSPFSTREDSVVIEMGGTMQFVYVARTPGWFVTTEARLSYYAYDANHADDATAAAYASKAGHATTADSANNAGTAATASKVANALTVNGKTYDGSSAVNAGVQTVANGGTGVTTQADINKAFIGNLLASESDVTDGTEFVCSYASDNGFAETVNGALNRPYKRQFVKVWNYIKDKISSVLGLTKDTYGGKASTAGTADKTVNDITIDIPFVKENGQYVIPLGNIPEPTSTADDSPYSWDITGFFSIIRPAGHNGSHLWFEAGHGYSHNWITYAYLDKLDFNYVTTSIKAFRYNGKWWLGLCIITSHQGYSSKMTVTYRRGLPATPTCILYYSRTNGVANEEIYDSIQDIPSQWWRRRTIHNPITFTQNIISPSIEVNNVMKIPTSEPSTKENGCIWIG